MRCSTCSELLDPGATRCTTCGAAVAPSRAALAWAEPARCPRCGYAGEGATYFSRTGHVGLLVALSVFTQGAGGLVYWLARRRHRVCPRCGLGWGPAPRDGSPLALEAGSRRGRDLQQDGLPSGGFKRSVLGALLVVLATILVVVGIADFTPAAIVAGGMIGALGSGTFFWGARAKQARRQAILSRMQRAVLRLATERGGTLTVTEVAASLNLSMPAAEKVLISMDDGFRVRSDITREGILLYEFPEVLHRLRPGGEREEP